MNGKFLSYESSLKGKYVLCVSQFHPTQLWDAMLPRLQGRVIKIFLGLESGPIWDIRRVSWSSSGHYAAFPMTSACSKKYQRYSEKFLWMALMCATRSYMSSLQNYCFIEKKRCQQNLQWWCQCNLAASMSDKISINHEWNGLHSH